MNAQFRCLMLSLSLLLPGLVSGAISKEIPNPLIDAGGFMQDVVAAQKLRSERRLTENQFLKLAQDPAVIVLDARSAERFQQMHIAGAKHLNFADFTAEALARLIPSKGTRILIYCNNNIENAQTAFPTKAAPAALNLSTYTSLYSYGYRNVYELGPVIDPARSKLKFEGTLVQ